MVVGPVLPLHPPSAFAHTTKNSSVSIGRPGPITSSHHPGANELGCSAVAGSATPEVTCASPVSACSMRTAFVHAALSVPKVS